MPQIFTNRRDLAKWFAGAGITASVPATVLAASGSAFRLSPATATVEWRKDPAGIDTRRPRFRWTLTAPPGARDVRQHGFRIRLIAAEGGETAPVTALFDSGVILSDALHWQPQHDLPLVSQARYEWRLSLFGGPLDTGHASEVVAGHFITGILDPGGWQAQWIAADPDGSAPSAIEVVRERPQGRVMPVFRRGFAIRQDVAAAYLSIAGLGHHACFLNGEEFQSDALSGGWTDFATSVIYDTHDVTARLHRGANTIAVMLGNGFFVVEKVAGRYTKLTRSSGAPRLIAQLRILFTDGTEQIVVSDGSWHTRAGPITFSSIYGGEDHDARRIDAGWAVTLVGAGWASAHAISGPGGVLVANSVPAMARARAIPTPGAVLLANGNLRYDFGVNFAGRPRLVMRNARPGQVVRLWPGELLMPDGSVDQRSMTETRDGKNGLYFQYTARGDAEEIWEPRFCYTGFRFVEIEGASRGQVAALEGCVMHAGLDRSGRFACSDPLVAQVHGLIEQALVSNIATVLTDCPHREKLGWLEQIYLNASTVAINRDAVTLYEKMARDMRASQQASGMVPSIAPEYVKFLNDDGSDTPFRDSPEWGSAIVLGPWAAYRIYGDPDILRDNWAAMRRYVDYLAGRARNGLVTYGLGDWFDLGPKPSGYAQLTSLEMTGTATLYADLDALARIAAILGHPAEERSLALWAAAVRETINARLYDSASGTYDRGSQAANGMALALGIAPVGDRPRVLANLIAAIRDQNDHVSAGDIGFHYVVRALSESGRGDVLYDMIRRPDAPSYLAQITSGATALTEAWDGARGKSQNHFMLGHVEQWFYTGLGGLNVDFARNDGPPILIAPQPVTGFDNVDVHFQSVLGPIRCSWTAAADALRIRVDLPAGAVGRVRLPTSDAAKITESGRALARTSGWRPAAVDAHGLAIDLGSGSYAFTVKR